MSEAREQILNTLRRGLRRGPVEGERRAELDRLVAVLLEKETVEQKDLEQLLGPSITAEGAVPVPLHFDGTSSG